MRKIWVLALAAALLTTACRIETNVLIDLNGDGTGSFGFEFGMDEEFRELVAAQGEELDMGDLFGEIDAGLPGAETSQRVEGDMTFSVVRVPFDDPGEFRQIIAAGEGEGGDIDVVWTEDEVSINATLEGSGEGGLGGLGDLGDLGDATGDLGGDFDFGGGLEGFADNFFSGSVIVDMPGAVRSHNADRVLDDGRLQWDLALDGSDVEITAQSALGDESGFPAWATLLLVLAALAVIVWLFSVQRRRRAESAVEAAGMAVPGTTPAPPAGWVAPSEDIAESEEEDPGEEG